MRTSTRLTLAYGALAAADTALAGSARPWAHRLRTLTKPLLMPTLAASLLTDDRATTSPLRRTTLAALTGGWIGDVALLGRGERAFTSGAGAFAMGHVASLAGFLRHRDRTSRLAGTTRGRLVAGAWAVSAPVVARAAYRQDRALGTTVLGYSALLATTTAAAGHLDPALPRDTRWCASAGSGLFLLSDGVLGARTFVLSDPPARSESAVMASYAAAQLLLVRAAARAAR